MTKEHLVFYSICFFAPLILTVIIQTLRNRLKSTDRAIEMFCTPEQIDLIKDYVTEAGVKD